MRPVWRWTLACAAFLGLAALLIWAFVARRGELAVEDKADLPIRNATMVARAGVIQLKRETQELVGLRVETLPAASLAPEVVAYGQIEEDPARSFVVRAPLAGTIKAATWPAIGQAVADQAVLGEVEPRIAAVDRVNLNDRLASARADMDAIAASRAAALAACERLRALNADNKNVSDRAVEEAEARLKSEEARYVAATQSVRLIEASLARAASGAVPLEVDRGGQVVEILARPGESIESGQPILRVSRFDRLLARLDVPAGESRASAAARARIVVVGREDRPLTAGRIGFAPTIDPKTQGQSFLFRVSGAGLDLRPGQAVTGYLELPGARRLGVIVPRAAVVRYAGKAWAYAQSGGEQFTRHELALEDPTAGGWFTRSLQPGIGIVTVGAQTLLSEELKSQIQVGEENPE